ncbi:hypothetical protein KAFR_0D00680 [Kazachstania africana CBS 2517]|uniref:SUN-like protein 1 n=1 Tax=Kazachstania africana (strain ATCC 22294 / BCRC 22015 / CBS 2517 / CECT 1963 / NBRC 1671 / NRRL Y-8276) TaxID=1071382 RepID=H2ATL5_KAZAF|nr:hypothetical protein KAFR_0D00680 [Kazachstania africana CBS 2517]CCF57715.1 hypothetical protein KAFR_0D00680 [Kazachstania africana CBS 2517]
MKCQIVAILLYCIAYVTRGAAEEGHKEDTKLSDNNSQQDNAGTFVSFEDWKRSKEEDISNSNRRNREPVDPSCYGDGECIGEEMEFEVNFFTGNDDNLPSHKNGGDRENYEEEPEGKLYKHKFNYASLDCAATIVKTNSEASGATSILIENKDKYLLNPCSAANKFVVIELCEDILIEEIIIANFEYFSSTFKHIRVSASDRFPVNKNKWTSLGEFDCENVRNLQRFSIPNPQIWARYLRLEILSHFDDEFYCPISLVRVHGKTMMDEFKLSEIANNDIDSDLQLVKNLTEVDPSLKETRVGEAADGKQADPEEETKENVLDKCSTWPYVDLDNKTLIPHISSFFNVCESQFEPLKFEEFLKEINLDIMNITNTLAVANSPVSSSLQSNSNSNSKPSKEAAQLPLSPEESIFKNIIKRIATLEHNATLTILYMEEQSKLLSSSFENLEAKYAVRFDNLIGMFNDTIMNNIELLKVFAKQLKDQSLGILEETKNNNDAFIKSSDLRIISLENEIRYQRKLVLFTLGILAVYHIYLLFSKILYIEVDEDEVEKEEVKEQKPKDPVGKS